MAIPTEVKENIFRVISSRVSASKDMPRGCEIVLETERGTLLTLAFDAHSAVSLQNIMENMFIQDYMDKLVPDYTEEFDGPR